MELADGRLSISREIFPDGETDKERVLAHTVEKVLNCWEDLAERDQRRLERNLERNK